MKKTSLIIFVILSLSVSAQKFEKLALTPPMGWNSWNCWGLSVDQEKVVQSARVFKEKGLMNHGWVYINIDDGWEAQRDKKGEI